MIRHRMRADFRTGVALFYRACGLDVFGMHEWLLETLSWPKQQREEWRLRRLGDTLEFAWNNVPFYREYWGDHGVEFSRPRALEEIQRYPILTKDVFRANALKVQANNLRSIPHRKWHTGGTTGQPIYYLRDLEQWTLTEAFHLWGWSQTGYVFGDPVGVIAGGSLIPGRIGVQARVRAWLHRRLLLYGVGMDATQAREYHARLVKHRAKFIYGYPSILYLFGQHVVRQGLSMPGLKGVVTTGEMLLPQYRKGIEAAFQCRVFDNLGCNDGGYEAYECNEQGALHYNDLQSILEVDSKTKDSQGRLLITNLWNRSMPFIRYENGDVVSLASSPCPCCCAFPVISSIQGRTADILTFSDGRSLSGPALSLIFRGMDIDGWQIVQTRSDTIEVRILSSHGLNADNIKYVNDVLRHYLSDDVAIVVKRVTELESTKAGKRKPIWSEI